MESKAIAMLIRLRLLLLSLGSGLTLLLVLCLGAQNLNDRYRLNLGVGQSAPLPSGFIVGISLVLFWDNFEINLDYFLNEFATLCIISF